MASEKAARILWKREAPYTPEQVAGMPEQDAWAWILPDDRKRREIKAKSKLPQVCFTGFKESDKNSLRQLASHAGFEVKDCVTKNLAILVTGENAGQSKLEKAKAQKCKIMSES